MQMLTENGIIGLAVFLNLTLILQGLTEYNLGNSAVMKSFWLAQGCLFVMSVNYKKENCISYKEKKR